MKSTILLLAAGALAASVASATTACKKQSDPANVAEDGGADAPSNADRVARGQYLVDHVFVCTGCHTHRSFGILDTKHYLGGEECMYGSPLLPQGAGASDAGTDADAGEGGGPEDAGPGGTSAPQIGCLNSRNLTNDPTGLRNFTDAEIKDMFLKGVRPNGEYLDPVMPYWQFQAMTAEDADSIVAYLRTVPGVDHRDKPSEAPWYPTPTPARGIDTTKIPMPPQSSPKYDSLLRGRYLAILACVGCHTPDAYARGALASAPLPVDETRFFAGGSVFAASLFHFPTPQFPAKIYSQNLTQDATGLAGYQVVDILNELKLGKAKDGSNVCPPMPAGKAGFDGLTDSDANDIAEFILSLPPISNKRPENCKL